jgi:hypothetical protein
MSRRARAQRRRLRIRSQARRPGAGIPSAVQLNRVPRLGDLTRAISIARLPTTTRSTYAVASPAEIDQKAIWRQDRVGTFRLGKTRAARVRFGRWA